MAELRAERQAPTYDADAIFEFVREANLDGHHWRAGDRIVGSQLTAAGFKYCAQVRLLRRVDAVHA
jgi:hypothetical protein